MNRNMITILVVVLVVLIVAGYFITNPEAGQQLLVELDLAEPERSGYQATGMLEATVYDLGSPGGGHVLSYPQDEGALVQAGQVVAAMDNRLQQAAYDAAQARVDAAQAPVDMIEAGPRAVDLAVLEAQTSQAEVAVEAAEWALVQTEDLPAGDFKDRQLAQAEAELEAAQAALTAAQVTTNASQEGATQAERNAAEAVLAAAQQALALADSVLTAQEVEAPIEGVVLEHQALEGEWVPPGATVVRLADLAQLEITVYLPVADLGWVALDDEVQVWVDAYPEMEFSGRAGRVATARAWELTHPSAS